MVVKLQWLTLLAGHFCVGTVYGLHQTVVRVTITSYWSGAPHLNMTDCISEYDPTDTCKLVRIPHYYKNS